MSAHAEIKKSRSKTKPFRVVYVASNGEPLAPSQNVTTRRNCTKNILAVLGLVQNLNGPNAGDYIVVHDFTDKKIKPFRKYNLYRDGLESTISR